MTILEKKKKGTEIIEDKSNKSVKKKPDKKLSNKETKSIAKSVKPVKKNTSPKNEPVKKTQVKTSRATKKSSTNEDETKKLPVKDLTNPSLPVKKENPQNKLYNLLTDESNDTNELEKIDPEALDRGDKPMTVVGHLDELRSRVLTILASFIILTSIAFYFSDYLVSFINKPFLDSGNKLNIFTIVGGFMLKFKVSAAAAIFILVPMIIFQIWRFIVPAIEKKSRTFSRLTILSAIILFYSGAAFVFFLILPAAIKVMLSFVGADMISTIGADDYLSFIIFFSLIMGIIFEIPVIILILTRLGIISPQYLINKRKYAIVIIWILAALITPPDPLSQTLVGIPLMLLYEISIIIAKIVARREHKKLNS